MRKQFRSFFQHIIDEILENKSEIIQFIREKREKREKNRQTKRQTRKNKTDKYI